MTSHQLAIAKASLTAGLLRADPVPVSRDEIGHFLALLEKALHTCSPTNIQNCKRWILSNVESKQRITALAKYLVALMRSLNVSNSTARGVTLAEKPSGRRKALHILYLLNDVLHHRKYHSPDPFFAEELKSFLPELFTSALHPGAVKQLNRLLSLLHLWSKRQYYSETVINSLSEACVNASNNTTPQAVNSSTAEKVGGDHGSAFTTTDDQKQTVREKQLVLPAFHGDPSLPFFDLPAANMLPHIIPNSTTPINPRLVRPIQFPQTKPTEGLQNAVQDFIKSINSMFGAGHIGDVESDSIGGVWGIDGEGYYGWSRTFCEKMKEKRKALEDDDKRSTSSDERRFSRRASYSSQDSMSRSRSRSRRRRPRSTSPSSRSISRSRTRSRPRRRNPKSRDRSGSSSPSRRSRSPSRSRSGSRSISGTRSRSPGRSGERRRSRSLTYSPKSRSPTYSPQPESLGNAPALRTEVQQQLQHPQQNSNSIPQVSPNPANFQALFNAYGLPQQQYPFNSATGIPPPLNVPLPPHVQTTAMIQQMIIQQQLQQYGYSQNNSPLAPQFHPFLQQMQQGQGFPGGQWPPAAVTAAMNYLGQQVVQPQSPNQQQQQQHQQPPSAQGPSGTGGGYGY